MADANTGAGSLWCAIAQPADGAAIKRGKVTVYPIWNAPGPYISKLDLLVDGSIVDTLDYTKEPRSGSFTWHATTGSHVLTCKITDQSNGTFTSDPVSVTVS